MMEARQTLCDLEIKDTYSSQEMDLVAEFYNPVLELAVSYDRITGFFSPKVFAIAARGFSHLIKNGGKVRLVTSVEVDSDIYRALNKSYFSDEDIVNYADWDLANLENELECNYLAVFSYMLSSGKLEIKVAITEPHSGILHQKIGIIRDSENNALSFGGSNNETVYGWKYNIEQFKVFKSWQLYSHDWYQDDVEEFERIWNNRITGAHVLPLSLAAKEKLIRTTKTNEDIDIIIEKIKQAETEHQESTPTQPRRELFDYQREAIDFWFQHGCVGIFEMATGTGKTFTTIQALKEFRQRHEILQAVVVVPLTSLQTQWHEELADELENCSIIDTSNHDWRNRIRRLQQLKLLGANDDQNFIIVTTYNIFNRQDFREIIEKVATELVLVADEMHNLATERGLVAASLPIYRYRLGLSATPERLWRPKNSKKVSNVFHDHYFSFPIEKAIERGFLVPFNYHPQVVCLDDDEYQEYLDLSQRISKMMARGGLSEDDDVQDDALKSLLIRRARIKKEASAKLPQVQQKLLELHRNNQLNRALIYVDNENYLTELQRTLTDKRIKTSRITGSTPRDERERIIEQLDDQIIDAIVAIKCLDEGVDIPSARRAFILANNTDPREYTQRLGRVLRLDRKHPGKDHADIYDYIVSPPQQITFYDEKDRDVARNLLKSELTRAQFFIKIATNGNDANFDLFEHCRDIFGFVFSPEELCYNGEKEIDNG